ncbi:major capsid protein [Tistrella bauzanensis]|uniref:major capsid protein n=1 Tax=Tistrella TaxID=171436 RepID=UPI0031F6A3CE
MENFLLVMDNETFSNVSMTEKVNSVDYVPGNAGQRVFEGLFEGIATDYAMVEIDDQGELDIIASTAEGGVSEETGEEQRVRKLVEIPSIETKKKILPNQIANVPAFGGGMPDLLSSMEDVVASRMAKDMARHQLTRENLRLGALQGKVLDKGGGVIADLFELFGVSAPADMEYAYGTDGADIQLYAQSVWREMKGALRGSAVPPSARIHCFCGSDFFDAVVVGARDAARGWEKAEKVMGESHAYRAFMHAGVLFEDYQGSTNSSVGIGPKEARFFWTGFPGMYVEWGAPIKSFGITNTIGLPMYARMKWDRDYGDWAELRMQQRPLPICRRPGTLIRGFIP